MKSVVKKSVKALAILAPSKVFATESFELPTPTAGVFQEGGKVVQISQSVNWFIKAGGGAVALFCFISAGNAFRQGNYERAFGALVGGLVSALASYFVGEAVR